MHVHDCSSSLFSDMMSMQSFHEIATQCPCLVTPVYTGQLRCSQGTPTMLLHRDTCFVLFFQQSRSGWRSLGAQQVWQRKAHSCILIWSFTEHGEKRKAIFFIAETNGPLCCYFVYNHRDLNVWALACGECVLTFTLKSNLLPSKGNTF